MSSDARARAAYEAFTTALGGIPRWEDLDERERGGWRASVVACSAEPAEPGTAKPRAFGAGHGRVTRFDDGGEE